MLSFPGGQRSDVRWVVGGRGRGSGSGSGSLAAVPEAHRTTSLNGPGCT